MVVIEVEVDNIREVFRWLEDNVGPNLTDCPTWVYNGAGWSLQVIHYGPRRKIQVEIDNPIYEIMFLLRWL
jgi:hypothetical protein